MFRKKVFVFLIVLFIFPLSLDLFLSADPQNNPIDFMPPPAQIQQTVPPLPEIDTVKERLPALTRKEIISWGFRLAKRHPFL